jgi:hypothetical protein
MAKVKQKSAVKQETSVGTAVKKMPRSEEVRQGILDAHQIVEQSYVDLAKLLAEAYHKEFYLEWGFADFKEYCDAELDVQYRKAMYLVEVADCIKKYKIPIKDVEKLGWTKMKDLATVITEENLKEWIAKAKELSSRELTEQVKISRQEDGEGRGAVPQVTTMKFTMGEAEANVITEALEEAKKLLEGGDSAQQSVLALEMICQDWLEAKGAVPERTRLSDHLKYLERIYGVTLTIKGKPKLVKKPVEVEEEEDEPPKKTKAKAKKKVVEEELEEEPEEEEDDLDLEEEVPEEEEPEEEEDEAPPPKKKAKAKSEVKKAAKKKTKKDEDEEEEDDDDQDLNDLLDM